MNRKMSLFVDKKDLLPKDEAKLLREAKVKELMTDFKPYPKTHKLYLDFGDKYAFPRSIDIPGKTWMDYHETAKHKISFTSEIRLYTGTDGDNPDLKEGKDQATTVEEGIKLLKTTGAAFYYFSTGYGKTKCAIETMRRLGRVTLIVAYNQEVQEQTYKAIVNDTDAKVYWFNSTKEPPPEAQIVVTGLVKASKLTPQFLSRFQMVVLDEVDQCAADAYFPLLLKIFPTYLLGLTATINKSNGLDKALYKYFGKRENFIYRFVKKPKVQVIKFQTEFVPNIETKLNARGQMQLDNHEIDRSLAEMKPRNKVALQLIKDVSTQGQVLVLSPRKENIVWLAERLTRDGYENDYKTVGKKKMDKKKPILLGGLQGCGRGYDTEAKILVILGIMSKPTQFVGRLRDPEGKVYVLVDKYEKHEKVWLENWMPYLRKLECAVFFQVQGEDEIKEYVVKRRSKKDVSLLMDIVDTVIPDDDDD